MNVTKQQQIEWLAKNFDTWPSEGKVITMSTDLLGTLKGSTTISGVHYISAKEWEQARDKMQKQVTQDNSWFNRGEFPPAGTECEALYRGEWIPVISIGIASSGRYCVFELPEYINDEPPYDGLPEQTSFRPLRTEREKAIDELNALVGDIEKYPTWRDAIAAIVDAGYHK